MKAQIANRKTLASCPSRGKMGRLGMSPSAKSHVFRNLSRYVRTGMGIERACDSLLSQPGIKQSERDIYLSIHDGVTSGLSIADSMSKSATLDALDYQMLDASERGGQLDSGLSHLSEYYERLHRTRRKIRRGLAYPIFLFHFALLVTTFAGAMFTKFNPANEEKPFLQIAWETGRWAILVYFILIGIGILLYILQKRSHSSTVADRLLNKIPLYGKARKYAALERFSSVFEIFLLAGMKMDESFRGSGEASNSALVIAAAKKGANSVRSGEKLSPSLFAHPAAFPNDFARGIASAEEAGMLDAEFARWKKYYGEALSDTMDQLAEWVPKAVYFTTLFVVAAMIIRAGLAYRDLINGFLNGF